MSGANAILGWSAVLCAAIGFGSFAVPMKFLSVVDAQIHPLVYQSYKTIWTFLSSHLVLLFLPYEFTWWGVVSGFLWVPAGVAAVFAIQNAGIARAPAIWQVTIILTSFAWSVLALHDTVVRSVLAATVAIACLIFGVVGMTLAFNVEGKIPTSPSVGVVTVYQPVGCEDDPDIPPKFDSTQKFDRLPLRTSARSVRSFHELATLTWIKLTKQGSEHVENGAFEGVQAVGGPHGHPSGRVGLGIAAALFNGIWGGSNLVPSHYAPLHGVHFVISFATGALIANIIILTVYAVLARYYWNCDLPSPQVRVMAIPGMISGLAWSLANFFALYAVGELGQGFGYSLVQTSVIVSGLWGIFYYREIVGDARLVWCRHCGLCVFGMVLLATQRA